ncbi:MAG: hypothetical protein J3R72DRAFT_443003 [Linnemannia gamsii]|nr:MAG: hypothetical protein J3R72DRAFT_443003 [Linnemannia gamsii]
MDATPATTSADTSIDTNLSQLGHLSHVRHFNLQPFAFVEYENYKRKKRSAAEQEYIQQPEFSNVFLMGRRETICHWRARSDVLVEFYTAILHREATWSLAGPILEQLESLTLPLSDIRRYLQVIDRLGRLKRVHILLDWNLSCGCCGGTRKQRKDQDQAMQQLIQFVQDHGRLFPGRLMHVNASLSHLWYHQDIPKDTLREILRILPPLYKVTSINEITWQRIAPHLHTTDFSHVCSIDRSVSMVKYQQVLQQCRSLCEISTKELVPRSFNWAVQEKRDMLERLGQAAEYPVPTERRFDALQSQADHLTHGLVPLARFTIQEYIIPSQDLDAITFAFSQSLEELIVENIRGSNNNDAHQTVHLDCDWVELPFLSRLELCSSHCRIVLDSSLFSQCPSLSQVMLIDDTFEYSCQEIVPWLPVQMPLLCMLHLKGWSALTFNPAILASAKKLSILRLTMTRRQGNCFIPPVDELDAYYGIEDRDEDNEESKDGDKVENEKNMTFAIARPQWTWDWLLPSLSQLELMSEFAYRFEFRMLQGCPALDRLRLYMRTSEGHLHRRLISESDLSVPGFNMSRDRIVAPMLTCVSMEGRWVIEDSSVLEQLLEGMFPKLRQLKAIAWEGAGFSLESFVRTIRSTGGRIKKVKTHLNAIRKEDEDELGVCRVSRDNNKKGENAFRTRLICRRVEYIVPREVKVLGVEGVTELP